MNKYININVSESDFKSRPPEDRDWILFQAITMLNLEGCDWGNQQFRHNRIRTIYLIGAGIGAGLGFALSILKLLF